MSMLTGIFMQIDPGLALWYLKKSPSKIGRTLFDP